MAYENSIPEIKSSFAAGKSVSIDFNSLSDIASFVETAKAEFSAEGVNCEVDAPIFKAKWKGTPTLKASIVSLIKDFPVKAVFDSADNISSFIAAFEALSKGGGIKVEGGAATVNIKKVEAIGGATIKDEDFEVEPEAEKFLDKVANIVKVFCIVVGVILIISGIIFGLSSMGSPILLLVGLLTGSIQIVLGYLIWAGIRVLINISHNLFLINRKSK